MHSFQGRSLGTIFVCIERQHRRDPHWNYSSLRY